MENREKMIASLDRNALIEIAKKLEIKGYKNNFNTPYLKKEVLKSYILNILNNKAKPEDKNTKTNCYLPPAKKVVAIGDIHGDLTSAIKSLKLAGVISKNISNNPKNFDDIEWIGGDTIVVQIGDQIDRVRPSNLVNNLCPDDDEELCQDEGSDLKIISLFTSLNDKAKKKGGAVISIIGNHELMNILGDFRYVSPREFKEFGSYFNAKKTQKKNKFPYGYKQRKEAFKPGGILSKKLANNYYSIFQVGSWVFVHGGISPELANSYTINDVNKHVKNWLLGNTDSDTKNAIEILYHNDDDTFSPFWCRLYSDLDEWNSSKEKQFHKAIKYLNFKNNTSKTTPIKGMIMGHTPQFNFNKGINSSCNKKLWRIDIGSSKAFGPLDKDNNKHRKVAVLVIENDNECKIVKEL